MVLKSLRLYCYLSDTNKRQNFINYFEDSIKDQEAREATQAQIVDILSEKPEKLNALLDFDGNIIAGTNFENAAYGSSICAERAAILRANSQGKNKFSHIAIYGIGKEFILKISYLPPKISYLYGSSIIIIIQNFIQSRAQLSIINIKSRFIK